MRTWKTLAAGCWLLLALTACGPDRGSAPTAAPSRPGGATTPTDAVLLPTRDLHDNDLAAFARDAVPPALHAQLDAAWRSGRWVARCAWRSAASPTPINRAWPAGRD